MTVSWRQVAAVKLTSYPATLRVINKQLWCCSQEAGIEVFDTELQQQRTVTCDSMEEVCDVAEMSNGDVVIAALQGLYHADASGNCCNNYKMKYP